MTKAATGRRRTPQRAWGPVFLEQMAKGHTVAKCAEMAGIARSTAYEHRDHDPEFAASWDDAYETGADAIVEAAYKRGVEGVEEQHYDKQGNPSGSSIRYSDRLLELLMKARRPAEFRERVDVNAKVESVTSTELAAARAAAEADPEAFARVARSMAVGLNA